MIDYATHQRFDMLVADNPDQRFRVFLVGGHVLHDLIPQSTRAEIASTNQIAFVNDLGEKIIVNLRHVSALVMQVPVA